MDAALGLLVAVEAAPLDGLQTAEVEHLLGQIALEQQRGSDAARLLLSAAGRYEPLNADLARETHLEALVAAMWADDLDRPGGVLEDQLERSGERRRGGCGREGSPGWSASTRKGYLSAIRFLYRHCLETEALPDLDPSARIPSPKISTLRGFTPTVEDMKALWTAQGRPRDRLLVFWMYYAPSRLATFADARWRDIVDLDTDDARWQMVGKGGKADEFPLHPILRHELRHYRRWQLTQAEVNPHIRAALSMEDTAYVLLSRTGRRMSNSAVAKLVQWRAIRAGVGVYEKPGKREAPGGKWTKLSPHAFRRAWAHHALNDPVNPVPMEVVSDSLGHKDIATTQRHYAFVKSDRARAAIIGRKVA